MGVGTELVNPRFWFTLRKLRAKWPGGNLEWI
jgi:hypothetical protein